MDVTLLDTYGQSEDLEERVRKLNADPDTGAIVVFSFSDQSYAVHRALHAGAQGFISKAVPGDQIIDGVRAAAKGERHRADAAITTRGGRRQDRLARTGGRPHRAGERVALAALDRYD